MYYILRPPSWWDMFLSTQPHWFKSKLNFDIKEKFKLGQHQNTNGSFQSHFFTHRKTFLFKYMLSSKIGKQCHKAQKYMITLNQRWTCTRRLIQIKRRIWEVNQDILHIQEEAYAHGKLWRNLKGDVLKFMVARVFCTCLHLVRTYNAIKNGKDCALLFSFVYVFLLFYEGYEGVLRNWSLISHDCLGYLSLF